MTAGTATKLNSASADYDSVVLSYDYKTVYFTAWDSNGYAQIYSATVANFNSPTQLTSSTTEDHHDITISKDGTLIATCVVNSLNFDRAGHLPSSGGAETLIAPTGMEDSWLPRFTPDKSTIIFEAETNALQAGIYSIQIGSTTPTRLTNASGTYWDWDHRSPRTARRYPSSVNTALKKTLTTFTWSPSPGRQPLLGHRRHHRWLRL